MSIIGTIVDVSLGEPRNLFDAVREELFTDLPSPESEVDVFVLFRELGDDHRLEVIDYMVTRIDREYLFAADVAEDSNEYLMAVDAWARETEGMDVYMWLHRHADGYAIPSRKDHKYMEVLRTIDYARGNHEERQFVAGTILDSTDAYPLFPGDYGPAVAIENLEIDLLVSNWHLEQARAEGYAEDSPTIRMALWTLENLPEFYDLRENDKGSERLKEMTAELQAISDEIKAEIIALGGNPDPYAGRRGGGLPPELAEILEDIKRMAQEMGFDPQVEPQVAEPYEPPPAKPKSVFDLPELGGPREDDPKINWN